MGQASTEPQPDPASTEPQPDQASTEDPPPLAPAQAFPLARAPKVPASTPTTSSLPWSPRFSPSSPRPCPPLSPDPPATPDPGGPSQAPEEPPEPGSPAAADPLKYPAPG